MQLWKRTICTLVNWRCWSSCVMPYFLTCAVCVNRSTFLLHGVNNITCFQIIRARYCWHEENGLESILNEWLKHGLIHAPVCNLIISLVCTWIYMYTCINLWRYFERWFGKIQWEPSFILYQFLFISAQYLEIWVAGI